MREVSSRVEALVGAVAGWEPIDGGHSGASRYHVELTSGRSVFVKQDRTPWTSDAVRREAAMYERLQRPFMPEFIASDLDDPPLIVLEDLTGAEWPPPWTPDTIDRVLATLEDVAATRPPDHLEQIADVRELLMRGWRTVSKDPEPFLSLGLCTKAWLDEALPVLLEAEDKVDLDGNALTHLDVRSDNICFACERTVLVDWSGACVAHPKTDLAKWLPSLHAEGGPRPDDLLPDPPRGAVAVLAGFWASVAGLGDIPDAPKVRAVQRRQLAVALPWAARTLGLPEPQRC